MTHRDKDIINILNHYVNRQSQCELDYIEDQKRSGIKICDNISHQRSHDGKDELVIETQLSSTIGSSESSGNRECTVIKTDNSCTQSRSSLSNSDYYIKELRVAHVGKSKSLDDDQINKVSDIHETHVTTIIGSKNKHYETVHKAVIEHSDSGRRQILQQESFVRDATKMSFSYHSLPGPIVNSISLPAADKSNKYCQKKTNKLKSWRSIFPSSHKKNKKGHTELSDIDLLAKQHVLDSKEVKVDAKTIESPLFHGTEMPFKSYKIGEPLQPMKKKKRMPYFLRSMLSPGNSLPRSVIWTNKSQDDNNNSSANRAIKEYSTNELGKMPVTRIVATLSCKDNDDEDFSYQTNGTTNQDHSINRHRYKSGPETVSNFHFDMQISDNRTRRKSFPDRPCNCDTQRLELVSRGLNCVIFNTKSDDVMQELDNFDKSTFHFKNCPLNNVQCSPRKDSECSSSTHSRLSLYQSCEYCNDADDRLHPEVSAHLLPLITRLEDSDEINFNEEHLKYFLSVTCYKQFEEGMGQAIGYKCSIRNIAHLHYVTRKIVRHIGDPNKGDNEQIRRIMHFAQKFCDRHYNRYIEVHGSMEDFLRHYTQYDID